MNIDDLETLGFVRVEYPTDLRQCVKDAMASWQEFCGLPDSHKNLFSGGDRVQDFGYMRRQDKVGLADDKELFHALKNQIPDLTARAEKVHDQRAVEFIYAVDQLIKAAEPLVVAFAKKVEDYYGVGGFEQAVAASTDRWVFRYLHYMPGETLAHAHADRGGFTFHLYESVDGGQYLGFDKKWHPWPVSEKETIIFPSMVLQHASQGRLKALCHRVVATEEARKHGRFSMVVFIHPQYNYRYDDSAKRLQDFEPGFNYNLPFPEFDKLFTPGLVNVV